MTTKDYLINLLLQIAEKHKDDPEVREAVNEAIAAAKRVGCKLCGWNRGGTCTRHFPGVEVHPYGYCGDWMSDERGDD